MIRIASLALVLAACSGSEAKDSPANPPKETEKVAVPGGGGTTGAAPVPTGGAIGQADNPKMHLQPDEGALAITKAEGKAGSEATANIAVKPATGFHISTEFPISLVLEPPAGVKVAKTDLAAGKGQKGDADQFSEQALAFAVKATADKPGTYEIKGMFKFGICDKESCHPKKQPIAIQVAAN